jgi:gliding motility-associated-like protein
MRYDGADHIKVRGRELILSTSFGDLKETIPSVYQIIEGEKIEIRARYKLKGNVVSFNIDDYYEDYDLIIDPSLAFSSFTGSSADNWGFTATFDNNGNLYGGGIVFYDASDTYPTTAGAFQTTFDPSASIDIGISKFSESGSQLVYSTYLGGNGVDIPSSFVVDHANNLYILGSTGSDNFPMTPGAYQSNFVGGPIYSNRAFNFSKGADIFIAKLSSDGTNLLASTYLGGSENDGINSEIYENYGDDSRGEIIYENGNVYIVHNTSSHTLPLVNSYLANNQGGQDAVIASFNDNLSNMNWGTFYGGTLNDAGYSVKVDSQGGLFAVGGSASLDLPVGGSRVSPNNSGALDGYVVKFDKQTGTFINSRYIGTPNKDQTFLVDLDKDENVYVYGQSKGSMPISSNIYANPASQQFIQKFDNSLDIESWSTQIGSGSNKSDLVPTAFLVDDCYNIYLSGWNGNSNTDDNGVVLGNTNDLPTTADAYQTSTDGSDFYFMVLDRDAQNLVYGSFFGGSGNEHVDGGTSRFDPSGSVFQAVCAGCSGGGFPTTPGAYSQANGSSNCNLGVIKLDFEATVRARPEVNFAFDTDTMCDTLEVQFTNSSVNADTYLWDFGNGLTSSEREPKTAYSTFGQYRVMLVALDTNCGISDTSYLSFAHTLGYGPEANFAAEYISCDSQFNVAFDNTSLDAHNYQWDFGDGSSSNASSPAHQYNAYGKYGVTLTAFDSICQKWSSFTDTIIFIDTLTAPAPIVKAAECGDGSLDIQLIYDRPSLQYFWSFGNGEFSNEKLPSLLYSEPGSYLVKLKIEDSDCNKTFDLEYPIVIENIGREMFIPNSFSPNGDGLNEEFKIYGNHCGVDDEIRIFNRWGELIFQTKRPFEEFWDAKLDNEPAPVGIYTYSIRNGNDVKRGTIMLVR